MKLSKNNINFFAASISSAVREIMEEHAAGLIEATEKAADEADKPFVVPMKLSLAMVSGEIHGELTMDAKETRHIEAERGLGALYRPGGDMVEEAALG